MKSIIIRFWRILRYRLLAFVLLTFLASLAEGLGILALLPILQLVVADAAKSESNDFSNYILRILEDAGVPFELAPILLIAGLIFLFKGIFVYLVHVYGAHLRRLLLCYFKNRFLNGLTDITYSFFSSQSTGRFVNIFDEQILSVVQGFFFISKGFSSLVSGAVFLILGFAASFQLASILFICSVPVGFLFYSLNRVIRRKSVKLAELGGLLGEVTVETFQGFKYFRSTGSFVNIMPRINVLVNRYGSLRFMIGAVAGTAHSAREPIAILLLGLAIYWQVEVMGMSFGTIIIAIILFYRALNNFISAQSSFQHASEYSGSYSKVDNFIEEIEGNSEPKILFQQKKEHLLPRIKFDNVCFRYSDNQPEIISNLTFEVREYTFAAIIGPSGVGKTTLIDIILGLIKPTNGAVMVDSINLLDLGFDRYRKIIGYVPQEPIIFKGTILQNILLNFDRDVSLAFDVEVLNKCLEISQLRTFVETYPGGLNGQVGDRGGLLSGGQRQRIHLARELYKQPSLLILDEATSALDPGTESAVTEGLQKLRNSCTIIAIAHRMETINLADQVIDLGGNGKKI